MVSIYIFSSGLKVLLITLYRSWKEVLLLVALLAMSVLIFGPLVYFAIFTSLKEGQPLNSMPAGKIIYELKVHLKLISIFHKIHLYLCN